MENENVVLYAHTHVSTLVQMQVCKHVRPYACAYIWIDVNADGQTDERHMYILQDIGMSKHADMCTDGQT